jgi:hypothetical protein
MMPALEITHFPLSGKPSVAQGKNIKVYHPVLDPANSENVCGRDAKD